MSIIDELFVNNNKYECLVEARHEREEDEATRKCCHELGGRLVDDRTRCELRDVSKNPEREWRQCARREARIERAECFRLRHQDEERRHEQRREQQHRDERREEQRRNDQHRLRSIDMLSYENESQDCQINNRSKEHVTVTCCNKNQGKLVVFGAEAECILPDGAAATRFRKCAVENGVQENQVECN